MQAIRELLASWGERSIISIDPDEMVIDAVTRMVENNVGAILVIRGDEILGIMTERDYLRFIADRGRTARNTPVREIMTRKIIYSTPDTSLKQVMAIMTEARIRHVPIMSEGRLMGIVSIGDLVKQIAVDQEVHIRTLEAYISDSYPGPGANAAEA
jgi:CBS domain-containing protein